jgi:hypothetical protein
MVRKPAPAGVAPERVEVIPLMTATVDPDPVFPMLIVVPEIVAAGPPGVRVDPEMTKAPAEFAVMVCPDKIKVGVAPDRVEVIPLMTATVDPDPTLPMLIVLPEIVAAGPPGVRVDPEMTKAPAEFAVMVWSDKVRVGGKDGAGVMPAGAAPAAAALATALTTFVGLPPDPGAFAPALVPEPKRLMTAAPKLLLPGVGPAPDFDAAGVGVVVAPPPPLRAGCGTGELTVFIIAFPVDVRTCTLVLVTPSMGGAIPTDSGGGIW